MTDIVERLDPDREVRARKLAAFAAERMPAGATASELRFLGQGGNLGKPGERLLIAISVIAVAIDAYRDDSGLTTFSG